MAERDVWEFYESLGDGERAVLSQAEREVAAICDLRQEVNSGGFDSYFRYWAGDTAELALGAIEPILGADWHRLLAEAMAMFGPTYPRSVDAREALLTDEISDALEAFDDRFFELEESVDADGLLGTHLG